MNLKEIQGGQNTLEGIKHSLNYRNNYDRASKFCNY